MKKLALALAVLLAATTSDAAEVVLVDMTLDTPSPTRNTMLATLDIQDLGFFETDTTTTTVSGTTKVNLGITADPVTNEVTGISTIQLVYQPGAYPIAWGNMSLYIDVFPEMPGTYYVSLDTANMAGTFNQEGGDHISQGPPSAVTGGAFDLGLQEYYADRGTMVMAGPLPSIKYPTLPSPLYWDLSVPGGAPHLDMAGTGTVNISLQEIVGSLATYDVDLVMPVQMDVNLWTAPPNTARVGHLSADGTIAMHGEMTRTVVLPPTLLGDANGDGFVDDGDATILATYWHQAGNWAHGDFNEDGLVNDKDASIMAAHWTGSPTEGQAEVPEPSTFVGLIGLALAGACAWRRR
jgi:hypothetical protein